MSLNQIFTAIRDGIARFFSELWNYPIAWGTVWEHLIAMASVGFAFMAMFWVTAQLFRGCGALLGRLFSRPSDQK